MPLIKIVVKADRSEASVRVLFRVRYSVWPYRVILNTVLEPITRVLSRQVIIIYQPQIWNQEVRVAV